MPKLNLAEGSSQPSSRVRELEYQRSRRARLRPDVSRETPGSPGSTLPGAEGEQRLGRKEVLARYRSEQRAFGRYTHSPGIPVIAGLDLEEHLVAESIQVAVPAATLKPQLSKPLGIPSFCGLLAWGL